MKILLVDDHNLFRAGLRLLLSALQPELDILECGTGEEAMAIAQAHPDLRLCLLDLSLRNESGMGIVSLFKQASPGTVVVVVSADENPAVIHQSLEEGAMGYIPKSVTPEVMTHALKLVLAGGIYLPPALIAPRPANDTLTDAASSAEPAVNLTARQYEVLQCLLRGWPNKLISRHLSLSENTVKTHLSAVYRALDVTTRSQAVIAAGRLAIHPEFGSNLPNASPDGD